MPAPVPVKADPAQSPSSGLPLAGVTVLELAVLFAAPYGATLLTDLGARVIKLEQLSGDPVRNMPGFPEVGGAKATQGKESVAVDISTPEGREIVHRLAARADAVIEGFRSGAAERHGVDAATLRRINPDLVYLSAHGYGMGGPCGDRPAFAPSIGAAGGVGAANLGESVPHEPCRTVDDISTQSHFVRAATTSRYAQTDGFGALAAATALLLGLVARARGHGGQHVSTSMLLTTAHALADHVVDFPGRGPAPAPGPDMRGPGALYRVYDASDGWVFLAAPQPEEWNGLVKAMAPHVDLSADPRFETEESRRTNDEALAAVLSRVFTTLGKHQWQELLTSADVACVAVHTGLNEPLLMSDDYGRASGYIADVEHPTFGPHPRLAPVVRFSRSATQAKPGTLCGTATQAVLEELGYSGEQIADLRARQVVG
jgi:crotonobetainyl-CoA:carnitine CoA-transferase CaiB-like acyl-CoA transferase